MPRGDINVYCQVLGVCVGLCVWGGGDSTDPLGVRTVSLFCFNRITFSSL